MGKKKIETEAAKLKGVNKQHSYCYRFLLLLLFYSALKWMERGRRRKKCHLNGNGRRRKVDTRGEIEKG